MDKFIFLDNGATSFPKPEEVYTFMDAFYRKFGVNPGRSGYDLCMETGELVENIRKMLTEFFNPATKLRDGLKDVEGVTLYCQDDLRDHISILLFNINGFEAINTG